MAELKTKPSDASVSDFLNAVSDEGRRRDAFTILDLMREVTGVEPRMWGDTMVGFGHYHYKYASGHEGDSFRVGFSPRKQNLVLYLTYGYEQHADLMQRLGKVKTGKACLYINKLRDVDVPTLRELIARSANQAGEG